jgi:hypothetical protein
VFFFAAVADVGRIIEPEADLFGVVGVYDVALAA